MPQMMDLLDHLPPDECLVAGASAGGQTTIVVALPRELSPALVQILAEGFAKLLARVTPSIHLKPPLDHVRVHVPDWAAGRDARRH
jgi:hypothetical protein